MNRPPQPPKTYRGYRVERFSRSFQVLFRAVKGDEQIPGCYSITELKRKIDERESARDVQVREASTGGEAVL